jgi:hypothetical protein
MAEIPKKVSIITEIYNSIIIIFWLSMNVRLFEKIINIQYFFKLSSIILIMLILITSQFIFELWASVYINEINWKTILIPISFFGLLNLVIIIATYEGFNISETIVNIIALIAINTFYYLDYRFENKRMNRFKKRNLKFQSQKHNKKLKIILWIIIICTVTIINLPIYQPI